MVRFRFFPFFLKFYCRKSTRKSPNRQRIWGFFEQKIYFLGESDKE